MRDPRTADLCLQEVRLHAADRSGSHRQGVGGARSSPRSSFPTRPGRRWSTSRPAGSATPTCTIASGIGDDFPTCSAMRQPGSSRRVGDGVTDVAPGDFVIVNWRAVRGSCRACQRGRPWYCFATHNATQKMTLEDGTELSAALGIGAFADKTLVHSGQYEGRSTAPATAAGLLGCGVMAGLGAALNTGNVGRRHGGRHRLRRSGHRRHRGRQAGGRRSDHRRGHRPAEARHGERPGRHPHGRRLDRRRRRRRARASPTASARTS